MGRYIQEIKLGQPIDVVSMIMEDYVYHHHFRRNDWNGEMVYYMKDKHGKERYMKWDYTNGVFHLEAWLKDAFGREADLKGFGSSASKNEFRKSLELLIRTVKSQKPSSISSGHVGSDPLHHTNNHAAEHSAQRQGQQMSFGTMPGGQNTYRSAHSNGGKVTISNFVYVMIALIFGRIPIIGLIIVLFCVKKLNENKENTSVLVRLLSILAIVMAVVSLITSLAIFVAVPFSAWF